VVTFILFVVPCRTRPSAQQSGSSLPSKCVWPPSRKSAEVLSIQSRPPRSTPPSYVPRFRLSQTVRRIHEPLPRVFPPPRPSPRVVLCLRPTPQTTTVVCWSSRKAFLFPRLIAGRNHSRQESIVRSHAVRRRFHTFSFLEGQSGSIGCCRGAKGRFFRQDVWFSPRHSAPMFCKAFFFPASPDTAPGTHISGRFRFPLFDPRPSGPSVFGSGRSHSVGLILSRLAFAHKPEDWDMKRFAPKK